MSMAKFGDVFSRGLASIYGPTASGDPSRAALESKLVAEYLITTRLKNN